MPEFSREYLQYLKSRQWQWRRAQKLMAANFSCERCGSGDWLQVHHRTYARFKHECDEDLEVLCRLCHVEHHDRSQRVIKLSAQIKCVKREISLRQQCYPRWVTSGRMRQEDADRELEAMEAVLSTLESVVEEEDNANTPAPSPTHR